MDAAERSRKREQEAFDARLDAAKKRKVSASTPRTGFGESQAIDSLGIDNPLYSDHEPAQHATAAPSTVPTPEAASEPAVVSAEDPSSAPQPDAVATNPTVVAVSQQTGMDVDSAYGGSQQKGDVDELYEDELEGDELGDLEGAEGEGVVAT